MPPRSSGFRLYLAIGFSLIALVVGLAAFFLLREPSGEAPAPELPTETESEVIGRSVEGRAIEAYAYGDGDTDLLFVGGIHGGYEWNSVALAYRLMDYLEANPTAVPEGVTVHVIPALNPDGIYEVLAQEGRISVSTAPPRASTAPGRFNANGVDLNRNFDCKWQSTSTWQGRTVSAGTAAFSEPEARALRDYVLEHEPAAVVFWHSQANAVYASECENGILPATRTVMNAYATAAGYPAVDTFDAYPISGDAEGWLASIGIPAITVELRTYDSTEWEQNLAGIRALLAN